MEIYGSSVHRVNVEMINRVTGSFHLLLFTMLDHISISHQSKPSA